MPSKITEQIWIGDSEDVMRGSSLGFNALLNCAFDLADRVQWPWMLTAHCGLVDGPGNEMSAYLSAIFQLNNFVRQNKRILVHSHEGFSRSVAVVMMYLNVIDLLGWQHWLNFIRNKRSLPDDKPNRAHRDVFEQIDWRSLRILITRE